LSLQVEVVVVDLLMVEVVALVVLEQELRIQYQHHPDLTQ
jgi:hypothetical protein